MSAFGSPNHIKYVVAEINKSRRNGGFNEIELGVIIKFHLSMFKSHNIIIDEYRFIRRCGSSKKIVYSSFAERNF